MPSRAIDGFAFVDLGRTFTCSTEPCRASSTDRWWWFQVSSERQAQRYAPFRVQPSDTRANVQTRIVRYYEDLQAQRAAPPVSRWGNRGRGRPTTAPAPAPMGDLPIPGYSAPLLRPADNDGARVDAGASLGLAAPPATRIEQEDA